jgi:hypothetical protein
MGTGVETVVVETVVAEELNDGAIVVSALGTVVELLARPTSTVPTVPAVRSEPAPPHPTTLNPKIATNPKNRRTTVPFLLLTWRTLAIETPGLSDSPPRPIQSAVSALRSRARRILV